jgi:hypothetical protein
MKVLMHALAASCEELRARTGNPPLGNDNERVRAAGLNEFLHLWNPLKFSLLSTFLLLPFLYFY